MRMLFSSFTDRGFQRMMNTLICLSWRFPIRKGYQPIWGFSEHPSSPRFPPCPTPSIGPISEQADRTTSDSIGPGRTTLAFRNSKMCRSFCLQLLLIFLPFSLPKSLHSVTSGTPGQDSCEYWDIISEINSKLNTTSVSTWGHTGHGQGWPGSLRPEALTVLSLCPCRHLKSLICC